MTLFLKADITIGTSQEPDFTRVFAVDADETVVQDELWMLRMAGRIADRYTDSGAVCVSNMRVVSAQPQTSVVALAA